MEVTSQDLDMSGTSLCRTYPHCEALASLYGHMHTVLCMLQPFNLLFSRFPLQSGDSCGYACIRKSILVFAVQVHAWPGVYGADALFDPLGPNRSYLFV